MQFYSLRVRGGGGFSSSFPNSLLSPFLYSVHPTPMLLCKALSGSFVVHQLLFMLLLTFVMCAVICLTFLDDAVSTNRLVLMSQVGRFMHANTLKRDYIFCSKIQLEMGRFPVENFSMLKTVAFMSQFQKCLSTVRVSLSRAFQQFLTTQLISSISALSHH